MANRTLTDATTVHGTNPQFLIEKILREKITDSLYWKEHCFALTAATVLDKAVDLRGIGGQQTSHKPTEFLCLTLKLLQLQPEKEIVIEYIRNEDFKYLRALGAFYLRLVGSAKEIYLYLEPLLNDYRKLRLQTESGNEIVHMDEFIDQLLREERVCDTILPRITKRDILEDVEDLPPRKSVLESDNEVDISEEDSQSLSSPHLRGRSRSGSAPRNSRQYRSPSSSRSRSRSPQRRSNRYRSPSSSKSPSRSRRNSRSLSPSRSPSRSPRRQSGRYRSPASSRSRSRSRSPSIGSNGRRRYYSPPSRQSRSRAR
ncbi:PRP38 family-domain-containing protein [Umbelopsis sp. PMI_123]|nr:PRP38 family-domain-containing protein [Umbelopsis sp. PMI_123]